MFPKGFGKLVMQTLLRYVAHHVLAFTELPTGPESRGRTIKRDEALPSGACDARQAAQQCDILSA